MSNERDYKAFTDALEQFATQYGYKVTNIWLSRPPIEFFGRSATDLLTSLNGLPITLEISFQDMKGSEKAIITPKKAKESLLSLHEAPSLPKLTADVFNRPDCPDWAQFAVLDAYGSLVFYEFKPFLSDTDYDVWSCSDGRIQRTMNKYDFSDWQNSLIERPSKLPDWCKVGEWVYCTQTGNYGKVHAIDETKADICINNNEVFPVKTKKILQYGIPARLRPYNADEMKALVGKVIEWDNCKKSFLIMGFSQEDLPMVFFGGHNHTADDLQVGKYLINRKICGVLEHLENGEWVE